MTPDLDFPCSHTFRQWEAQEGQALPDIDTRSAWEKDFDRQHPVDADGYSLEFIVMCEPCQPTKALPQPQHNTITGCYRR